jgi:hypothetical protein
MTWLRRAAKQRAWRRRRRPAARESARRSYRPFAEWLEDRTVLSTTPVLSAATLDLQSPATTGRTAAPLGDTSLSAPQRSDHGSTATAAQQSLDLTALLFASGAPDLPAIHLPPPATPFTPFVPPPKIGVYPVLPARPTSSTGPGGGVVPPAWGTSSSDSYTVFFPPPGGDADKTILVHATAGQLYEGAVATVTIASPYKPGARYQATIDWGDGSRATIGTIHVSGNQIGVDGRHTYIHQGHFAVEVRIEADGVPVGSVAGPATVGLPLPSPKHTAPHSDKAVPSGKVGAMSLLLSVGLFRKVGASMPWFSRSRKRPLRKSRIFFR